VLNGRIVRRTCAVRADAAGDAPAVRAVHMAAFDRPAEADLVEALRRTGALAVSCVAEADCVVVGHVALSPVTLGADRGRPRVLGLGPMAVAPERQRTGIGTALVRDALARARAAGWTAAVVLGHPEYYPRFGFRPASTFGIGCRYDVPDAAFMAMELVPGSLAGTSGTVEYHPAFDAV
jgi:putative acetyltransferase